MAVSPPVDRQRIAIFLATSGQSGVDRAAKNLIPALARRGYAVDLLKVRNHGPELAEVPAGVRVVELGSAHVYSSIPAVVTYLRRERPAVLFSDKDRVNRAALFAHALARVPAVRLVFCVGTPVSRELSHRSRWKQWSHRFWMRTWYPHADEIVVDSPGVADDLREFAALGDQRLTVVPRPVIPASLLERAPPPPDHPWLQQPDRPVILGVGELSDGKDHPTLIRAFARLRSQRPCRLVIVGKGGRREALFRLAQELGVADDVDLPGFRTDVYAFMAHASLFALTSVREGLSFVLLEALACGTPVVSTDCPTGPRAVLQGGRYGPLVPVGDVAALHDAMVRTLATPLPADELKNAARPYEIESATGAWLRAVGLPEAVEGVTSR
jgi:glycosyltransferase involved in cell wall biosynthesis